MKRIFDLTIVLLLSPLIIPAFSVIALLVRLKLDSPVIFKQSRPGLNSTVFNMYKFRSMTNECDKDGTLLSNKARVCF